MSFKEFKDALYIFTQKFSVKTEEYARITKINIEIKKIESDINKKYKELGKEIYALHVSGVSEIQLQQSKTADICATITEMLKNIDLKKIDIDEIRKAAHLKESEISAQMDSDEDDSDF